MAYQNPLGWSSLMGKNKRPRKPKPPAPDENPSDEELEPPTQAKGELGPPARRPPTAVGTEAPPPAPREPIRLPQPRSPLPERRGPAPSRPVLYELLRTIRTAVGAMLDIADAAAEAIRSRLEGRA
jgi:hypothetical protein